jgi:glutamate dehydrogenase/leucine dehydrogenase
MPLLKNYYGTGGDLNVDEIHEVIPITEDYGLWHPQEGVVNGHFNPRDNEKIHKIGQLRQGVSKVIEDPSYSPDPSKKLVVADMITGWGVSESVRHFYALHGEEIKGKKVIIQGWGNVAAAAGYYLAQNGASIVGIIDRVGGVINDKGFSFEEVRNLFLNRKGNTLNATGMLSPEEMNKRIWSTSADIFIPAAASRLITQEQIKSLIDAGLKTVSCGANVPFADKEIFFGPIGEFTDNHISLIPDFIANCGMARVFGYLMQSNIEVSDKAIFEDASSVIYNALKEVYSINPSKTLIAKSAFEIALKQLL